MVKVNGTEQNAAGLTLLAFLEKEGYDPKKIAVEKNGEIVPKAQYEETILKDGDALEVVRFVGGG